MSDYQVQTNFFDSNGVDLGKKLITRDYLFDVYPSISEELFNINSNLWVLGAGDFGKLGTNDIIDRSTPVTTFAGETNWKQLSAGFYHSAAIKNDGTLWTWGYNVGQLGTNDIIDRYTPVTTFAGGTNWKQVTCGNNYTAAIKTDGTLWTWGINTSGQLGTNNTLDRSTPVTTSSGGTNWKQVSAGSQHTSAIKTDGTLWVWGDGASGQLGINATLTRSTPVTTFAGGTDWKQVSSGSSYTTSTKTDGTLWVWGANDNFQLGISDTINRSTPVTIFAGGTDWKQVSAGFVNTASIKNDGTLWIWGFGGGGQLGTNDIIDASIPVTTFAGGTNWKQVSVGFLHVAAVKTNGTLWAWGNNVTGQLGVNDIVTRFTPVTTFSGGTNWKQVSAGYQYNIALEFKEFV